MLPRGADGVLEIFRAVLREDELAKSQASPSKHRWRPWPLLQGKRCQAPVKVAEAIGACRAAVWARRPGIDISTEADLLLVGIVLRLLLRLGLISPRAEDAFESFVHFTRQQLNLQNEVNLLQHLRSALPKRAAPFVAVPRLMGCSNAEVAIVSWEDGICLSEVTRKRFGGCYVEETELCARRAAARQLARTFWMLLFEHGIALGGLCSGNVLIRTAIEDENHLEVVLLRCGLCHEVDPETVSDLRALTRLLRQGASPQEIGRLILTRVHGRSGGRVDEVHDKDGFFASVADLLGKSKCVTPPLRGALLLHRFLETLQKHRLLASEAHMQVATSAAATNAVCCRLDPFSNGGLYEALLEVEKASESKSK